jgi:hypothetical protein
VTNPAGEAKAGPLRLDFDHRVLLQFRGSVVTSDAGLLAYRELDDALDLSNMAAELLADSRTGKNQRHALVGLLRQSIFGRLAGYEDVNDARRMRQDPAIRWIVGGTAAKGRAASNGRGRATTARLYGRPALDRRASFAAGLRADVIRSSAIPAMAKQRERGALRSAKAAVAAPKIRKRAAVGTQKRSPHAPTGSACW